MSKVIVEDLVAGYVPGVDILKGVTFSVEEQEILTIIGPNGSGKSTLLKSTMGYVRPRSGTVTVSGAECTFASPHRRVRRHRMGFVPQLANVFGPMTIRDNLRVGGFGLSRRKLEKRIDEVLGDYQTLADRENARADSLSGGERQLLAVCRALIPAPDVLLLDEPSAGLSPAKVTELFDELVRVRDRAEVTIICVEQNAVASLEVSDRGLVLVQGEVALSDGAATMLQDPQVRDLYLGGLAPDAEAHAGLEARP